jgi:RNA polymerase sigma-70 factor, ECF subfamily
MRVAAFEKNVEATIPALRRYARALTRDSEIADNLVERTLVRALRSKHLFNGGVVRDRLYAILTNLNHDRISSLARPPMLAARRQQPS